MPSIRVLVVAASLLPAAALAGEVPVWFGTYTSAKTGSEGIYVARFDTDSGAVSRPVLAVSAKNPSFLAFHPRLPLLYAVSEIAAADGRPSGAVEAFAIDEATGSLASRGAAATGGAGPCHVAVDPQGRVVLAANYGGGSVACLGLADDGRLQPLVSGSDGSGVLQHAWQRDGETGLNPQRQDKPHAHSVDVIDDHVVVCDLGLDTVFLHRFDPARATLASAQATKLAAGAGPRHFALHPDRRRCWCANELDRTVTSLRLDERPWRLTVEGTHATLPPHVGDRSGYSTAEIAVHPDGRFVYVSNRGHDSIAMFRIVDDTSALEFLGTEPTRGKTPRHFAIAPGGRFLLAGGQASNTVTVFAIDKATGRLTFTGTSVVVPSPVCIAFRP
jgi:6-phosphogluconolactonase